MFSDVTREDYNDALERVAEDLLWEAGMTHGAVDAFELAQRLGVVVLNDDRLPRRGQYVRLSKDGSNGTQATVLLGREPRIERRQWALAHERGEGVANRVFEQLGLPQQQVMPGMREQVANQLAARLLLPLRAFRKAGTACDWSLHDVKEEFPAASHELIARRLLDLRQPVVVTVVDQSQTTWRRGNFAGAPSGMLAEEWQAWQDCHELGQPTAASLDGESDFSATIRCWPVHEPQWRREIMVTTCDLPM